MGRGQSPSGGIKRRANVRFFKGRGPEELTYPEGSIIVVGGLPGVGKSTLIERAHTGQTVLSTDHIADQLEEYPEESRLEQLKRASRELEILLHESAQLSESVIIDAPALFPGLRSMYQAIASSYGRECHAIFLDTSFNKAKRSQKKRGRVIPVETQLKYEREWETLKERFERGDDDWFNSVVVLDRKAAQNLRFINQR